MVKTKNKKKNKGNKTKNNRFNQKNTRKNRRVKHTRKYKNKRIKGGAAQVSLYNKQIMDQVHESFTNACKTGDITKVKFLLENVDKFGEGASNIINKPEANGYTPLHLA